MENKPTILKAILAIGCIALAVAIIEFIYAVATVSMPEISSLTALITCIYALLSSIGFFGFYYIVKAACIYIEEKEKTESAQ